MRGIISDPDPSKRCGSFGSGTLIQPYKFDMDTQPNSKSRKIEWSEEWSEEDDPTLSLVLIPIFSPHSVFQRCRNTFRSVSSCSHLPWKPHFTWDLLSKNSEAHTAGGGGSGIPVRGSGSVAVPVLFWLTDWVFSPALAPINFKKIR